MPEIIEIGVTIEEIEALAPLKGFIVQDGNNIPPGSPLANINAMMEEAELHGRYR